MVTSKPVEVTSNWGRVQGVFIDGGAPRNWAAFHDAEVTVVRPRLRVARLLGSLLRRIASLMQI